MGGVTRDVRSGALWSGREREALYSSGVGSGVAPGARAPPCCTVLESFHKWETCFAGRIFRAWSGGPSPIEPPRGIERAWLREATADLAEKVGACTWSYVT